MGIEVILLLRHELFRIGFQRILTECNCGNFIVIHSTSTVSDALQSFTTFPKAILIIDAKLTGGSGIEFAKQVLKYNEDARIIIMTSVQLPEKNIKELEAIGIRGCVNRAMEPKDYAATITKVHEGNKSFSNNP